MRLTSLILSLSSLLTFAPSTLSAALSPREQAPLLLHHASTNRPVSETLFNNLEELARIVDITYCVGSTSLGIVKPFSCLSRCSDFPSFELVKTWNTGPLLSDSCGYIALDHNGSGRIIVAFRGTYSIANTVVDLSAGGQEYIPYPGEDGEDEVEAVDTGYGDTAPPESVVVVGEDVSWQVLEDVGEYMHHEVITEPTSESTTAKRNEPKCSNCTVHTGFHTAWLHTRDAILQELSQQLLLYPHYELHLVGHSLGGAVAALAALDLQARGWDPIVTTFGEPRVGNEALARYLNERFNLDSSNSNEASDAAEEDDMQQKYRRVTHISDPVPLLPLTEWNYAMHSGEIFISKSSLSPAIDDLHHCNGNVDQECIAGEDSSTWATSSNAGLHRSDLMATVKDEIHDVIHEPWGIPSRYKLWQLFFAHRDYFWRLGVCAPSLEVEGVRDVDDVELGRE